MVRLAVEALLSANKHNNNLQPLQKGEEERMENVSYTFRDVSDLHVVLVQGLFEESRIVNGIILESSLMTNVATSSDANMKPLTLALLQFPLAKVC